MCPLGHGTKLLWSRVKNSDEAWSKLLRLKKLTSSLHKKCQKSKRDMRMIYGVCQDENRTGLNFCFNDPSYVPECTRYLPSGCKLMYQNVSDINRHPWRFAHAPRAGLESKAPDDKTAFSAYPDAADSSRQMRTATMDTCTSECNRLNSTCILRFSNHYQYVCFRDIRFGVSRRLIMWRPTRRVKPAQD